jgi:NAD(P)-dependent dehydrogenase (short-subunit alcohol dehydrogenase family)
MRARLKPLAEQVIVITGASSGIGLAAARKAVEAGAAVVLTSRDERALQQAYADLSAAGGRIHSVVGDPGTRDGAERIGRAAAARFGHFDTWIDADGGLDSLPHAAEAALQHFRGREGAGAVVGFGTQIPRSARLELKRRAGSVAGTLIRLPSDWRHDSPADAVAAAALHASVHPMGRMDVGRGGRRLTTFTEAQKHRGVLLGVGVLALAAGAVWLGRRRIAGAARPVIGKALRHGAVQAARRRPLQAARLAIRHPRQALKLARAALR